MRYLVLPGTGRRFEVVSTRLDLNGEGVTFRANPQDLEKAIADFEKILGRPVRYSDLRIEYDHFRD